MTDPQPPLAYIRLIFAAQNPDKLGLTEEVVFRRWTVTMAWDGIERRKSYCPICKDRRAKPITVTEGGRMRVVELECEQCGFKWQLEQPMPGER